MSNSYDEIGANTPNASISLYGASDSGQVLSSPIVNIVSLGAGSSRQSAMYFRDDNGDIMFGIVNYNSVPRLYVYDSGLGSYRTLTLRNVTINGTTYYLMAAV